MESILGMNSLFVGDAFFVVKKSSISYVFPSDYFTWDSLPKLMIESIGICLSWTFHNNASLHDVVVSSRFIFPRTLNGLEGIHASSFTKST